MSQNEIRAYVELFGGVPTEEDIFRIDPNELFYHYGERITFPALVAEFRKRYGDE
jgi:hypothetical protein